MYRTLSELRDSINELIEQQGENAPCAAFVFTGNDVFEYNEETGEIEDWIYEDFRNEFGEQTIEPVTD